MIALGGVTLIGLTLGIVVAHPELPHAHRRVQIYATLTGLSAMYFFCWALLNSLRVNRQGEQNLDLGVLSFLFPLAASIVLLVWPPEESRRIAVLRRQRLAVVLAPFAPIANYSLGLYVATNAERPTTLLVYFAVAIGWWTLASLVGLLLLTRVIALRALRGESDALATREIAPDVGADAPA